MYQLVDYWHGGYNEKEKFGLLDLTTFELNYYNITKIQTILKNNETILGLKTLYSFELDLNDTTNKYITRVLSSDYNRIVNTQFAKIEYGGVYLILNRPIKLKHLISGVNFEYKSISFSYKFTKQKGKHIIIRQPNWKDDTLNIMKEIIGMFDFSVEIEYPFRVNSGNNSLCLQSLLDIIDKKQFSLRAINYESNYKAIQNINVGNLDFSKLSTFSFLFSNSLNLKYVDFSDCVSDLKLTDVCIIKNINLYKLEDKIQDALNDILYSLSHRDLNYNIVFILNNEMRVFAEILSYDKRVIFLGNLIKDNNLYKNIDILISKYLFIRKKSTKANFFFVFVK